MVLSYHTRFHTALACAEGNSIRSGNNSSSRRRKPQLWGRSYCSLYTALLIQQWSHNRNLMEAFYWFHQQCFPYCSYNVFHFNSTHCKGYSHPGMMELLLEAGKWQWLTSCFSLEVKWQNVIWNLSRNIHCPKLKLSTNLDLTTIFSSVIKSNISLSNQGTGLLPYSKDGSSWKQF